MRRLPLLHPLRLCRSFYIILARLLRRRRISPSTLIIVPYRPPIRPFHKVRIAKQNPLQHNARVLLVLAQELADVLGACGGFENNGFVRVHVYEPLVAASGLSHALVVGEYLGGLAYVDVFVLDVALFDVVVEFGEHGEVGSVVEYVYLTHSNASGGMVGKVV